MRKGILLSLLLTTVFTLQSVAQKNISDTLFTKKIHLQGNIIGGIWVPHGNLKVVGNHPIMGTRFGLHYNKIIVEAVLRFKFNDTPNPYYISHNDSIYESNHFFGGYLGLDLAYEIFTIKKNRFDIIGGIAYSGFDAVEDIKSINSINFNFGIGYKYFINNYLYCGMDMKYNIVNFKNDAGTNLEGNNLTLTLLLGFGNWNDRYPAKRSL